MALVNLIVVVIVASMASMAVGMLWYSKPLFGNAWMSLCGFQQKEMNMFKTMSYAFLIEILIAVGLLFAIGMTGMHPYIVAPCLWLAAFLPVTLHGKLYYHKPWKLILIEAGHYLIALLASATVYLFL